MNPEQIRLSVLEREYRLLLASLLEGYIVLCCNSTCKRTYLGWHVLVPHIYMSGECTCDPNNANVITFATVNKSAKRKKWWKK
jgi:hypothetical protein